MDETQFPTWKESKGSPRLTGKEIRARRLLLPKPLRRFPTWEPLAENEALLPQLPIPPTVRLELKPTLRVLVFFFALKLQPRLGNPASIQGHEQLTFVVFPTPVLDVDPRRKTTFLVSTSQE